MEMAKIQKGEIRNPVGFQSISPEVKRTKLNSRESIILLFWDIMNLTKDQIEARLKERPSLLEEGYVRAIVKDMQRGTVTTLNNLTERVIGKPKEFIDVSGNVNLNHAVDISKLSTEELDALQKIMMKGSIPLNGK